MSVYYNDADPFACAWLRELAQEGHIAKGTVDERSIKDVDPANLVGRRRCHFFAGIGGWELALQLAGWPESAGCWTGSCPCQPFSSAGKGEAEADPRHLWPDWFRLIRVCRPGLLFGEQVASKAALAWLDGVFADLEGEGYACGAVDLCSAGIGAPHIRQRLFWVAERVDGLGNAIGQGSQGRGAGVRGGPDNSSLREPPAKAGGSRRVDYADGLRRGERQHSGDVGGQAGEEREHGRQVVGEGPGGAGAAGRLAVSDGQPGGQGRQDRGGGDQGGDAEPRPGPGGGGEHGRVADPGGAGVRAGGPGEAGGEAAGVPGGAWQQRFRADAGAGVSAVAVGVAHPDGGRQQVGLQRDGGQERGQHAPCWADACGSGETRGLADAESERAGPGRGEPGGGGAGRLVLAGPGPGQHGGDDCRPGGGFWDAFDIVPCRDDKARRVEPGSFPLAYGVPRELGPLFAVLERMGVDPEHAKRCVRNARGRLAKAGRNRSGRLRGFGNAIVPEAAAEFVMAYMEVRGIKSGGQD